MPGPRAGHADCRQRPSSVHAAPTFRAPAQTSPFVQCPVRTTPVRPLHQEGTGAGRAEAGWFEPLLDDRPATRRGEGNARDGVHPRRDVLAVRPYRAAADGRIDGALRVVERIRVEARAV